MIWLLGDHKILCYIKSCHIILHGIWIGSKFFLGVLHRQKASCIRKWHGYLECVVATVLNVHTVLLFNVQNVLLLNVQAVLLLNVQTVLLIFLPWSRCLGQPSLLPSSINFRRSSSTDILELCSLISHFRVCLTSLWQQLEMKYSYL